MYNKAPMWNESSQVYQLDFGGRVTQESAKNFQIEFGGKQVRGEKGSFCLNWKLELYILKAVWYITGVSDNRFKLFAEEKKFAEIQYL